MTKSILNELSKWRPFRWFLLFAIALTAGLTLLEINGYRLFGGGGQQQFNASGPGYHK